MTVRLGLQWCSPSEIKDAKVEFLDIPEKVHESVMQVIAQLEESIAADDPMRGHPLVRRRLDCAFDNLHAPKYVLGQWDPIATTVMMGEVTRRMNDVHD